MINPLPEFYPDELFYSLFSRYYAKSGYITYIYAVEDLFVEPKKNIDYLYLNQLKRDVVDELTKQDSWENLLIKHTLFPYYGRFVNKEKRISAFQKLKEMKGDYNTPLSVARDRKIGKNIRYCPICAKEQRDKYGETYWSRIHQLPEISVCPIHGCKLLNSVIKISKGNNNFYPAETEITDMDIEYGNDSEVEIAKYLYQILECEFMLEKEINYTQFLISRLPGNKYISARGGKVNLMLLSQDMQEYFGELSCGVIDRYQIVKLFKGKRRNPYEIAQVSLFLNIPVKELLESKLPEKSRAEIFDEKVLGMIQQGMTLCSIAKALGVNQRVVSKIAEMNHVQSNFMKKNNTEKRKIVITQERIECERAYFLKAVKENPNATYQKLLENPKYSYHMRWLFRNDREWLIEHRTERIIKTSRQQRLNEQDEKYLPTIKQTIEEYKEKDGERPKRITIAAINSLLGLIRDDLYYMPKCREIVEKYYESQEEYWAREVIWAVNKLIMESKPLNFTCVSRLTSMRKERFIKCIPYLNKYADNETVDMVIKLVEH